MQPEPDPRACVGKGSTRGEINLRNWLCRCLPPVGPTNTPRSTEIAPNAIKRRNSLGLVGVCITHRRSQSMGMISVVAKSDALHLVEELTRAPRMDSGRARAAGGQSSTGPAADEEGSAATAAAARLPAGRAIPAPSR